MMVRNDEWLREWIKEELKEGVGLDLIKETLAEHGYDPRFVDDFLKLPVEARPPIDIKPSEVRPSEEAIKPPTEVPREEKSIKPPGHMAKKEWLIEKVAKVVEKLSRVKVKLQKISRFLSLVIILGVVVSTVKNRLQ